MRSLLLAALIVLLAAAGADAGSLPETINYQGRLTENTPSQTPLDATVTMDFSLWDDVAAGTQLWSESGVPVTVTGGIFNVLLGANGTPLPASLFDTTELFLELTVAGEILSPRQRLSSVAFARRSEVADDAARLGGAPSSAYQKALSPWNCPSGEVFVQIRADGTAQCAPDATGVTAVVATAGLSGSITGSTLNLATDVTVQRRNVSPQCGAGEYLQAIAANGTPTCADDAGVSVPMSLSGNLATPIFESTNSGAGEAVKGHSYSGYGIRGQTNDAVGGYSAVIGTNAALSSQGSLGGSALLGPTPTPVGVFGGTSTGYGVYASTQSGRGVYARAAGGSGVNYGLYGQSDSTGGYGIYGLASATTGTNYAIYGQASSATGFGVAGANQASGNFGRLGGAGEGTYGYSLSATGTRGETSTGTGVAGLHGASGNLGRLGTSLAGVFGTASGGTGVRGESTSGTGVVGYSGSHSGIGLSGSTLGGGVGVRGTAASNGIGVDGVSSTGIGVSGTSGGSGTGAPGVLGASTAPTGTTYAVYGEAASTSGRGVYGHATATSGSTNGVVGRADSPSGAGVRSIGSGSSGVSLQVESGAIRVPGAGVGTSTTAYIHQPSGSDTGGDTTTLNHTLLNGNPDALVFASPVSIIPGSLLNFPWSLYYDSGISRWRIRRLDLAPDGIPTNGARWNILIIVP